MSLEEGIQVINNCTFMNSLFPLTGKIDKQWGKHILSGDLVYIIFFSFHEILQGTYYLPFLDGQNVSSCS